MSVLFQKTYILRILENMAYQILRISGKMAKKILRKQKNAIFAQKFGLWIQIDYSNVKSTTNCRSGFFVVIRTLLR